MFKPNKITPIRKPLISNGASKSLALTFGTLAMVVLIAFVASAWTEPSVNPPNPDPNISTPLNIGSTGQSKTGGLILNTGGAPNGLIVQNGNVGIGTTTPAAKLDVQGGVKVGSYAVKPACNANVIGMIVFDTANDQPYVCASTGWNPLDSKANLFGNGSDGDIVLSSDTNLPAATGTDVETGIMQYNNLTINAGVKLSVPSGHVLKFKVKDTLTINGEINMDGRGGMAGLGEGWDPDLTNFRSDHTGEPGEVADFFAGGPSFDCFTYGAASLSWMNGILGSGGGSAQGAGFSNGGRRVGFGDGIFRIGGNGGGGGATCNNAGGSGGAGGGVIMISAKNIVLNGNIYSRGIAGQQHPGIPMTRGCYGGGGGGGGGGVVILEYNNIAGSGSINMAGGAGGSGSHDCTPGYIKGSGDGGAGSKGIIFFRKY